MTRGYAAWVVTLLKRTGRTMLMFTAIVIALVFSFSLLPSSFLPEEDQGYFMTSFQLPSDATTERTLDVVKVFEKHVASRPGIDANQSILGFSFSGAGTNTAMAFTMLKDWSQRNGATAADELSRAQVAMSGITEGTVFSLMPPAIDELGTSSGFTLRLQDRSNKGEDALRDAQNTLLKLASQSQLVTAVYPDGVQPGSNVRLDINRKKAETLGVSFTSISDTLSTAMGSAYVNDFVNAGRVQQVIVQADAKSRMQLDDVLKLYVRSNAGQVRATRELVTPVWGKAALQQCDFRAIHRRGFQAVLHPAFPAAMR
jgi:multidrug efflux pump